RRRTAIGEKRRTCGLGAKWLLKLVGHGIEDEECVRPGKRRNVAVGAVHRIAVEQNQSACLASRGRNPVLLGKPGQALLRWNAHLLLLQRRLMVVLGRFAGTGDEVLV